MNKIIYFYALIYLFQNSAKKNITDNKKNMDVIGGNIIFLKEIGSTNDYLIGQVYKKRILEEGTVVVTQSQTRGKGLENNFWESEPGKNLTFSVLLRPVFIKASQLFILNKAISLGVMDFVKSVLPNENISIKWPNDIYINDGKVAGILINNSISGNDFLHAVAGIGINVNQTLFSDDTRNPVSLKQFTGQDLDLKENLRKALSFIDYWYQKLAHGYLLQIDNRYVASLYRLKKDAFYKAGDSIFEARIIGVSFYGKLQMVKSDGEQIDFDLKEIEYIL